MIGKKYTNASFKIKTDTHDRFSKIFYREKIKNLKLEKAEFMSQLIESGLDVFERVKK